MVAVALFGSTVAWLIAEVSASNVGNILDGVTELDIKNFVGNAGNFDKHPASSHEHALVAFYTSSCEMCNVSAYEYRLVARTLRAKSLDSKVLVARVEADATKNKAVVANFQINTYPSLLWLSKGDQDWEALEEHPAEYVLSFVGKRLGMKHLQPVSEDDGVVDLNGENFIEHAGNFDKHPKGNHTYALVNFYMSPCENCQAFAPAYRQLARFVRASALHSRVLVAHVNASNRDNQQITERFQLKAFPSLLWLTKGNMNWEKRGERTVDEMLSLIGGRLGEQLQRSEL
mmetsp:Transcript_57716/g.160868  ORF Transcript_57716/g.160868 Transcript_57716/m.160868 type:complete len:288 (+) Transcript_57716:87-950(+)|eukprot:CAMPEP_0117500794 /NCGR_PEP_ID=MMETSP0784-20121206/22962_1 /TAXON_ID=39447 /ORGANISM="" /LENGTH=287 /DNA_ID=CAMNT_0005296019 /DNA_START=32 /DNA_END=895 /DNA_ORIENTATION=-